MGRGKGQAPDLGRILCERGVWTPSAADFGEKLGITWPSGFPGPIYASRLSDLFQQSQVPIPALSGMGRCSLIVPPAPPARASSWVLTALTLRGLSVCILEVKQLTSVS